MTTTDEPVAHAAGPWEADHSIVRGPNGVTIVPTTYAGVPADEPYTPAHIRLAYANARAIAALPELIDAAGLVLEELLGATWRAPFHAEREELLEAATALLHAAYQKAVGES